MTRVSDPTPHGAPAWWSRAGWVALAVAGMCCLAWLLPPSATNTPLPRKPPPLEVAAHTAREPEVAAMAGWDRLPEAERTTLAPLRGSWSTLSPRQQAMWRLMAQRSLSRPPQAQRRLAARMQAWARMTPEQRARARFNLLQIANRYRPGYVKQQWQAYQGTTRREPVAAAAHAPPRLAPPAFAQASPGATTVLLSQLFELPPLDGPSRYDEPAAEPPATHADGLPVDPSASGTIVRTAP